VARRGGGIRRAVFLAAAAPIAGRIAEKVAFEMERRQGPNQTTRRLRQGASFLRGGGLGRYVR
jgi:hypothetical protein